MPPFAEIMGWRAYIYGKDHSLPHFHLRKAGQSVSINIMTGELLEGQSPGKTLREVQRGLAVHREDVLRAWTAVRNGHMPPWIQD